MRRIVALGASNLTRGFATLVSSALERYGEPLEVLGALGHGRSYGVRSRVLVRSLPGILECGLWDQLASLPPAPTQAFVTDVGNDILYDVPVATILDWVSQCVSRLGRRGASVTITDIPLASIGRLGPARFTFFRSILVPSCRLRLEDVLLRPQALNEGLLSLARSEGLRLVGLRSEWYGLDPIHIRPSLWATAWREILADGNATPAPGRQVRVGELKAVRLYLAGPERRWICGVEQRRTQPAITTRGGTTIWLY